MWKLFIEFIFIITSAVCKREQQVTIGIDAGTESIRVGVFSKEGKLLGSCAVPYETKFPCSGWAEQNPNDWYFSLSDASKRALVQSCVEPSEVKAITLDSTACSVLALDKEFQPIRPCILWMDARSASKASSIMIDGAGDPAVNVNCGGKGPLSAEWMIPKALWIKSEEPATWQKSTYICEKQDFLNYKLTGNFLASACNVAARWHWNAEKAVEAITSEDLRAAQPVSLLEKIGLTDILEKWPQKCVAMGGLVGHLTSAAAIDLGLPEGIPVYQGGPDAYVGMIGLGCVKPGQLALITGSSHLHLCIGGSPTYADGVWGAYEGAPMPGMCFSEGGQSSTGSVLSWAKRLFQGSGELSYKTLDEEASRLPVGADGLIALETFQGSRTPVTDPLARGALLGLSLSHSRAHIWRALLESICLGTRAALEALENAGFRSDSMELLVAGGATRSLFWLQMHADVTGLDVVVGEFDNAPLLGCAILASVGVGIHANIQEAVAAMVRPVLRIKPRPEFKVLYDDLYNIYKKLAPTISDITHTLASGDTLKGNDHRSPSSPTVGGVNSADRGGNPWAGPVPLESGRQGYLVPSILAADTSDLASEIDACLSVGANWLHVDVCDGSEICQKQLTFGPLIVGALQKRFPNLRQDVHVAAENPWDFVDQFSAAGAYRYTFQWESLGSVEEAIKLANHIRSKGMKCGVCLRPSTPANVLDKILELTWLDTGRLIDFVDILAVEPGIGGQPFQMDVLHKIRDISTRFPELEYLAVDGGVNLKTAELCCKAGANVLIAGSSIFRSSDSCNRSRSIQNNILALIESLK